MKAIVLKTGPGVTIQDLGRDGGGPLGLSPGGAMDRRALEWANRLLGNPSGVPGLELAIGPLEMRFDSDCVIALTGAEAEVEVEVGAPGMRGAHSSYRTGASPTTGFWRTVHVGSQDVVRIGQPRGGRFTYVGFTGGLITERFHGSASTVVREGLPGLLGRALRTGDEVRWPEDCKAPVLGDGGQAVQDAGRLVPVDFREMPDSEIHLPIQVGYDWLRFTESDRRTFLESVWRTHSRSDRVATLLEGPALESGPRTLDSVPMVNGTIQVLANGQPLIFMRDRPTIGGYPKLGSVMPTALDLLAQAMPGTRVRFVEGDPAEERLRLRKRRAFFGMTRE